MKNSRRKITAVGMMFALGLAMPAGLAAQAAPDPDLVVNPNFEIVAARLDRNGNSFSFIDLTKLVQGLQKFATELQAQLGSDSELEDIPGKIAKTAEVLGFDQLAAFGQSSATRKDGRGQIKTYLKFTRATGLFAQDGETRKPLRLAAYGPPTAALLGASRWNPRNLWEKSNEVVRIWAPEEEQKEISDGLKKLKAEGMDVEKAVASLGREFLFALLLDPTKTQAVPQVIPNLTVEVPKPGFLLMFEVLDSTLRDLIVKAAVKESELKIVKGEKDLAGWELLRIPVPGAASEWIEPVVGFTDNLIAFSLLESDLTLAVKAHKDKKDFRTTADFQKIATGLPDTYQAISYVSPLLPATIRTTLEKVMASGVVPREGQAAVQQFMRQFGSFDGFASVQTWDENGVQDLGRLAESATPFAGSSIGTGSSAAMVAGGAGVAAAIAVPNFLEAQTRAKVSRAKSDMRSLATAIESYYVDFNVYPPSTNKPGEMYGSKPADAEHFSTFRMASPTLAMPLTTPIGYLTSSFFKGTDSDTELNQWGYFSEKDFWVVWSPGPDKEFNLNPADFKGFKFPITSEEIINQTYDPTNGTISAGDIWRVKQ